MTSSDQINELAAALSKAQGEIAPATRAGQNPHYNSTYATIQTVLDVVRAPLAKHGLSVVQFPSLDYVNGNTWLLHLETRLMHASGQWLSERTSIPVAKADAQAVGSAITYARRYALQAVLAVPSADDDGNAAAGKDDTVEDSVTTSPSEFLTVTRVQEATTQKGTLRYMILFSDGKEFSTLDAVLANSADVYRQEGVPVERGLVKKGRWTNLETITAKPVVTTEPTARLHDDVPPPDESEIPF